MEGRGSFWIFAGGGLLTVVAMAAFEAPSFLASHLSHVNQNAPPAIAFQRLLMRDLLAFFAKDAAATKVDYRLIRNPAAQSATADSNYYAWVQVYAGESLVAEGAVRFAAADRTRFEINRFFDRASIVRDPARLSAVFPEPVVNAILVRARAER
jgi:hypothetical protein